ncbi:MAG: tripartite tricarboxylate transporter substrate binding protein [Burkholderiales bacterium]|nr:tripartite tricarboxylate transporter substrate binding protein [Burkholderiales bacterium]
MNRLLAALCGACAVLACASAAAQPYPGRPVKMLVGYAAGGGADALARLTATQLGEALGQSFVVENRAGAGGTLAADAVAKAPADGYTLLFGETGLLIAPAMYPALPFDPVKSFAPVGGVTALPLVIVVNPSVAAKNAAELIALVKASPGKYSYASPGVGSVHHLAMELLKKSAGLDYVHVPYKGASAIIPDLVSGQIPIAVLSAPPALAQARAGKLRAIALTSPVRVAGAPDWPALADTIAGFDASPRLFVLAPAGTPGAVVARLDAAIRAMLARPAVVEALAAQGATPSPAGPEELGAFMAAEVRKWGVVARESGAKAQ